MDELIKIQTRASKTKKRDCIAFGRGFDLPLLMWEFDHFLEYGLPYCTSRTVPPSDLKKIRKEFLKIAEELTGLPQTFTHRDFHSRNLMIYKKKIWVLDFQDALMGPSVYDLASLLRDSYTVLEEGLADELLSYYRDRTVTGSATGKNPETFRRIFDLMSIQRNLKAAGRFVYINQVKRNPKFLPYIPPTLRYVIANLKRYSELSRLHDLLVPYLEEAVSK